MAEWALDYDRNLGKWFLANKVSHFRRCLPPLQVDGPMYEVFPDPGTQDGFIYIEGEAKWCRQLMPHTVKRSDDPADTNEYLATFHKKTGLWTHCTADDYLNQYNKGNLDLEIGGVKKKITLPCYAFFQCRGAKSIWWPLRYVYTELAFEGSATHWKWIHMTWQSWARLRDRMHMGDSAMWKGIESCRSSGTNFDDVSMKPQRRVLEHSSVCTAMLFMLLVRWAYGGSKPLGGMAGEEDARRAAAAWQELEPNILSTIPDVPGRYSIPLWLDGLSADEPSLPSGEGPPSCEVQFFKEDVLFDIGELSVALLHKFGAQSKLCRHQLRAACCQGTSRCDITDFVRILAAHKTGEKSLFQVVAWLAYWFDKVMYAKLYPKHKDEMVTQMAAKLPVTTTVNHTQLGVYRQGRECLQWAAAARAHFQNQTMVGLVCDEGRVAGKGMFFSAVMSTENVGAWAPPVDRYARSLSLFSSLSIGAFQFVESCTRA